MPTTINITTSDPDFVAALVTFLLEQPAGVSWYVEGGTDDDFVELAAGAATNARTLLDELTEPHPVVQTIGEVERERLIATWDVKCPSCKAPFQEACRTPNGTSYGTTFVHNSRRHAAAVSKR